MTKKVAEAFEPQDLCLFKTNIAVSQYLQHSLIKASTQLHVWITAAGTALHGIFDPLLPEVHKMHRESEFLKQTFWKHRFLVWIHTQPGKNILG